MCVGCASDAGIGKDGKPKDSFTRGMELRARVTLFAEGCRGSCSESVMKKFNLREGKDVQTYGLGLKEVWQIPQVRCGFIFEEFCCIRQRFPPVFQASFMLLWSYCVLRRACGGLIVHWLRNVG